MVRKQDHMKIFIKYYFVNKSILISFLLLGLLNSSCNTFYSKIENDNNKTAIIFQPFNDFPINSLKFVEKKLVKTFPNIIIQNKINLPSNTLNDKHSRYRAEKILSYLGNRTKSGYVTIGFTNREISTTMEGKSKDWRVFGLGWSKTHSCVVSTFKIKGKNHLEKLFKLSIHEIGHTQNLNHCNSKSCYMRAANGKDHLNELKEFCSICKDKLLAKGWKI